MGFTNERFFSLTVLDTDYFNDMQNKIEIVGCDRNELVCAGPLADINKRFLESERCRRDKNYPRAIEKLKNAYYLTTEISDKPCMNCSKFFRNTIIESLHLIKNELKKLTTGFFANPYYKPSYLLVEEALQELEKVSLSSKTRVPKSKDHVLNSYPQKSVS
jgi:hypothetical protein